MGEQKGRFCMVNGDEGNERGEKGMFGMVNDDGGDERGKRGRKRDVWYDE